MLMDLAMIVLAILNLCGVVSGQVVSIDGIIFACMVAVGSIIRKMEK